MGANELFNGVHTQKKKGEVKFFAFGFIYIFLRIHMLIRLKYRHREEEAPVSIFLKTVGCVDMPSHHVLVEASWSHLC